MRKPILSFAAIGLAAASVTLVSSSLPTAALTTPGVTIVTSGLENPRGLKFGPDGQLYVAEGGLGGSNTTSSSQCQQVPPPVGPYSGGTTARISKINPQSGSRTTVIDGLPSSQTAAAASFVSGVGDISFLDGHLYALLSGAGCSHGLAGTENALLRIDTSAHTATKVADLSAFLKAHPGAHPDPGDYEPEGTWYSLVTSEGLLYAVEPNHQVIETITPGGQVKQFLDMSVKYPGDSDWRGPTGMVRSEDNFYFVNLNPFKPTSLDQNGNGRASLWKLSEHGRLTELTSGLTAALGVAVHDGSIYALEAFTGTFAPTPTAPSTGKVVRLNKHGGWDTVVSGLNFPTAMTFGTDGNLYISNNGFVPGLPASTDGQVVRVHIIHDHHDD
jgi:hypothetical protein